MDLDQQIQLLVENAPQDQVTPQVMEKAIAPVLKALAQQVQHLEYYILQTLDQGWVATTLSSRVEPDQEKSVIYAFPTLNDATTFQGIGDPNVIAVAVPITHIFFQLFALEQVSSVVCFNTPGNLQTGTEIRREDLQNLVQQQLQKLKTVKRSPPSNFA